MKDLFVNTQLPVVTSDRILYTPSNFARNSLLYLQEIGSLRVHKPHSTGRSNLSSYLFFTVTDGEGELICEGRTYSLRTGDCVFIDCRKRYAHSSSEKLWGYAKDYVECMWLIMQQEKPEDFVIATGVQHTVRDFTEKAFVANGMTIRWEGTGIDEKGYDVATGKMLVCVNPQWFRPTDVDNLWGDPTKAKTVLGWNPQKTSYEELVEIMAKNDRELAKREKAMKAVM